MSLKNMILISFWAGTVIALSYIFFVTPERLAPQFQSLVARTSIIVTWMLGLGYLISKFYDYDKTQKSTLQSKGT